MEAFLAALAEAQVKDGATVGALVHAHEQSGESVTAGVHVWRAPTIGNLLYTPISPSYPLWLGKVLSRFKPQVLHMHMPNPSVFWALLSPAARRLPWIVHWHSDVMVSTQIDWRLSLAYPLYAPFERAVLARANAIVATSPPYIESSPALAPWRSKCRVVPLAISDAVASSLTTPQAEDGMAWLPHGIRVLSVGRLTYYKGHAELIRAAASNPGVQVIIVGEGDRRPHLENLIRELNLGSRVRLLGGLPDHAVRQLFRSTDIFCLPSLERTEAFGMVLLEAMAAGKPVIASDIPGSGVGWVLQHGETAVLVPPGDVGRLSAAIAKMTADTYRSHLGVAGQARFNAAFRMASVVSKLSDIYSTAVG